MVNNAERLARQLGYDGHDRVSFYTLTTRGKSRPVEMDEGRIFYDCIEQYQKRQTNRERIAQELYKKMPYPERIQIGNITVDRMILKTALRTNGK